MLQVLQNRSIQLLETIVNTLDSYEEIKKRPRRFGKKSEDKQDQEKQQKEDVNKKDQEIKADDEVDDVENQDSNKQQEGNDVDKFKNLSFELIDIGLFFGEKGIQKSFTAV